ncbi:hypothetical protein GTP46_24420 [Duganella sp. FT135W]|uniref:PhiE125 gp8 family phage protein n=1 Tax=Duganella flavida TaxID=2692175 RepID=A0A6L8KGD3_9BURK|nr:hypothetical protein [Duganella flavida]MYM25777.1 hypothetical protein [Duganella flavida]
MTAIRTTAPSVLAVTLEDAKGALRVDGDDLDAQITIGVKGIIADLEQEIGQCVMKQTWEVRLPYFPPDGAIKLPHPVISITSLNYIDAAGVTQTIAGPGYRLNKSRYASTLTPARGESWPATAEDDAAVIVVVQAGYGESSEDTPEEIELYILAKLAEQFDPATRLERDTVQSNFVTGLLDRCRSYG